MMTNEQKMRDLLGVYYDSSENKLSEVATVVSFKMQGTFKATTENISYDIIVTFDNGQSTTLSTDTGYGRNKTLSNALEHYYPHFSLQDSPVKTEACTDRYDIKIKPSYPSSIREVTVHSTSRLYTQEIVTNLVKIYGHIPHDFVCNVEITRHENSAFRAKHAGHLRNTLLNGRYGSPATAHITPELFFRTILNPTRAAERYPSSRGNRNFEGALKKALVHRHDKKTTIFLVEYLYGKKFSQSTNCTTLMDHIAALPYNDFGIRDVAKLAKLRDILDSYNNIPKHYEQLTKLGIPQKSNLKRWKSISKPATINESNTGETKS